MMQRLAGQEGTYCLAGFFVRHPPSIAEKNAAWYTIYIVIYALQYAFVSKLVYQPWEKVGYE